MHPRDDNETYDAPGPRGHRRHQPPWANANQTWTGGPGEAWAGGPPWGRGAGRGPGGGRGRGRGRGPRFGDEFGFEGGPPFFGRGPRAARGDVRAAVLHLLKEEPMHGYQIMSEIRDRSGGVWKPSPGSVYPTLQQLEDEGLIASDGAGGKKVFHLTEDGVAAVAAMPPESATPWLDVRGGIDPAIVELRQNIGQLATAAMQVAQVGTATQKEAAQKVLTDARKQLYRLLAGDDDDGTYSPTA